MGDLEDRIVLVTGGSRGIGRAIALELARAGAHLVVGYRADRDAAGDVVAAIRDLRRDAVALPADVRRPDDVDTFVTQAQRWRGRLHAVVTCAGVFRGEAIEETEAPTWEEVVETDLGGTFRVVRAAVPHLLLEPDAAVVCVSSVLGSHPAAGAAAYQAAKGGVEQLTRALAVELGPRIRVNAVAPGYIQTEMNRGGWSDPGFSREVAEATPLGRWGAPEDVAPVVRFLLSDAAAGIRGVVLPVDGGVALR